MNISFIGISGKMASGKDTLADLLEKEVNKEISRISFGELIRIEINEVLESLREESVREKFAEVDLEDVVNLADILGENDIFNRSPESRKALQYWGTEVRRKQDGDYWIKRMKRFISEKIEEGCFVFLTDARFPVEVDLVKELDGLVLRLESDEEKRKDRVKLRDGIEVTEEALNHVSERALDNYYFENIIENNGSKEELLKKALEKIRQRNDL